MLNYVSRMLRCNEIALQNFAMRRITIAMYRKRFLAVALLLIALSIYFYSSPFNYFPLSRHPPLTPSIAFLTSARTPMSWTVTPLVSKRNFWGIPENLEFPNMQVFNPSFISLPTIGNSNESLVVVAREYGHRTADLQPEWVTAALLHLSESEDVVHTRIRWDLNGDTSNQGHSLQRLDGLIHSNDTYFPKCDNGNGFDWWFRDMQGPEDPRLFWTHIGEPLIVYNSISAANSDICRHMYLVDLRSVYSVVKEKLSSVSDSCPIRFPESVPLLYANPATIEKNWSPFSNSAGDIFLQTHAIPQRIYKLKISPSLPNFNSALTDLSILELVAEDTSDKNCIALAANHPQHDDFKVHNSTPFIEVVLCTFMDVILGVCDASDPANRLYIGLIHIKHPERRYERRIVTLNSTIPWNYVSISKPLMFCTSPLFFK